MTIAFVLAVAALFHGGVERGDNNLLEVETSTYFLNPQNS